MIFGGNDFGDFNKFAKNKKVIAFGAGDFLASINTNFADLNLENCIDYIVDNDANKLNSFLKVGNRNIKVEGISRLLQEDMDRIVVLITSQYYANEIFEQLNQYNILVDVVFFVLPLMIRDRVDDVYVFQKTSKNVNLIPKIIHCCWFSGEEKDELSKRCFESWKEYCHDYEIIEWNCNNYDVHKNKFMEAAYKAKKWAYVSDYARIDILSQIGGIYLDLDVELFRSLDILLNDEFFIGFGPTRNIEAAAFGSVRKQKILNDMLDIYSELIFPNAGEKMIPQPVYLNELFKKQGFIINGKYQKKLNVVLYPKNLFSGRDYFTGKYSVSDTTIGIHHCSAGWFDPKNKKRSELSKLSLEQLCLQMEM